MKNKLSTLIVIASMIALFASPAFAADETVNVMSSSFLKPLGLGLAALGGGLGQGKAIGSAMEAIGRNPSASGQMFVPYILGLVFIEAIVIFTWLVAAGFVG